MIGSLVSMPISIDPKFRADFFRYSNLVMSSSGPKKFKNSFRAPGLCGILRIKYFLTPLKRCDLSLTSGNRSKSKFPPVVIQTTDLPLIDCPKSCNASIERAPAGSRTIPLHLAFLTSLYILYLLGLSTHWLSQSI